MAGSLDELNDYLRSCDDLDDAQRIATRRETVAEAVVEAAALRALPVEPFDAV